MVTANGAFVRPALPESVIVAVIGSGSRCVTLARVLIVPLTPMPVTAVERTVNVVVGCASVLPLASVTTADSVYVPGALVPTLHGNDTGRVWPGAIEAIVWVFDRKSTPLNSRLTSLSYPL